MDIEENTPRSTSSDWNDPEKFEHGETGQLLDKYSIQITQQPKRRFSTASILITSLNILILCLIVFITVRRSDMTEAACVIKTRAYTPVYKTFTPSLHDTTINGSFFNSPSSIYREDPNRSMNAEWDRISSGGWMLLTRSDIISLQKDPSTRARASPALLKAMGRDPASELYYGHIDAIHQLHCLNAIRKHAYWDSYYAGPYGSWDDHGAHELHWTHISHCFEVLRQNLMCNADAGVFTNFWMAEQPGPMPDFNAHKTCGDFEGLKSWQEEHGIPNELAAKLMVVSDKKDSEVLYPIPPELYAAKGVELPEGYVSDHEVPDHRNWFSSW